MDSLICALPNSRCGVVRVIDSLPRPAACTAQARTGWCKHISDQTRCRSQRTARVEAAPHCSIDAGQTSADAPGLTQHLRPAIGPALPNNRGTFHHETCFSGARFSSRAGVSFFLLLRYARLGRHARLGPLVRRRCSGRITVLRTRQIKMKLKCGRTGELGCQG